MPIHGSYCRALSTQAGLAASASLIENAISSDAPVAREQFSPMIGDKLVALTLCDKYHRYLRPASYRPHLSPFRGVPNRFVSKHCFRRKPHPSKTEMIIEDGQNADDKA